MATVSRIAVVSCPGTIPFVHGVQCAADLGAELLLLPDPAEILRRFSDHDADIALVPAVVVPSLAEARIITGYCVGADESARAAIEQLDDPLVDLWRPYGELPFAFAVWVARPEVGARQIESLEEALTFGLEHSYEALVASGSVPDPVAAYGTLMQLDYLYDTQKHQALEKFWEEGLKVAPRANPG